MTIKIKEKGRKADFLQASNFGKGTTVLSIEIVGRRNDIYLTDRQLLKLQDFISQLNIKPKNS